MDKLLIKVIRLVPDNYSNDLHQKPITEATFFLAGEELTEKEIQRRLTDAFQNKEKEIK